jgi:Ni,Fe-hydrogenase III small subunit/formate hydrogenlyase subunit 6/NADH:ubiquinone oxidoreductase subunit I
LNCVIVAWIVEKKEKKTMIRELLQDYLLKPIATSPYPPQGATIPATVRGRPTVDSERCSGEGECVRACPTEAIQGHPWHIDLGKCIFCGACAEACPSQAISLTQDVLLAARKREDLIVDGNGQPIRTNTKNLLAERDLDRPSPVSRALPMLTSTPQADMETLGQRLKERLEHLFKRSLHIRHLDSGSCNGCDWELTTLLNPIHDIQRFGLDFVASPRHADLLLTTGTMTRNLTVAAMRTYQAMPEPRLVVAVGACGCSGGIFAPNYAGGGGTQTVLPVDVYIPGCPPRPQSLISGLLLAMGRLERKRGNTHL